MASYFLYFYAMHFPRLNLPAMKTSARFFLVILCAVIGHSLLAQSKKIPRAVMANIGYYGIDQQLLNPTLAPVRPISHGAELGVLIPAGSWADIAVRTALVPKYAIANLSGQLAPAQWISASVTGRFSTRGWLTGGKSFFTPYITLGVGVEKWSSELAPVALGGLGFEWRLAHSVSLLTEAQYRYRLGYPANLGFSGGIAWNVTRVKAPKEEPKRQTPPVRQPAQANNTTTLPAQTPSSDRDGDGVLDAEDRCPDLVGYIHLYGCPTASDTAPPAPTVQTPPSQQQQKPNNGTPGKVAVSTTTQGGNTPPVGPATQVGKRARNIAKEDSVYLESCKTLIHFEPNSDKLTPASLAVLDKVAEIMKKYPNSNLHVSGHTDNTLDQDKSLVLSVKRAYNVKYYLVYNKGIKMARITSDGYGSDMPVGDNKTVEGRKSNARVEFDLYNE